LAPTLAGAAALIMLGNVLSRVLALGRVMLSSYYFGVSPEMESFTIADNVRTMLFDLLISGMISAALVPVFSAYISWRGGRSCGGSWRRCLRWRWSVSARSSAADGWRAGGGRGHDDAVRAAWRAAADSRADSR
jgi:hypothetical protein